MAINNPYIPGDPYSYDLKWMVQEVKAAQAVGEQAAGSAAAAAASAEAAGDSAYNAGTYTSNALVFSQNAEASAENAADSAKAAAGAVAPISQALNAQGQQISVLKSRMDTFSSLTEGSTTGDAELQDIRVAADGTVYPTAGDAVRAQVNSKVDKNGFREVDELNTTFFTYGDNRFNIEKSIDGVQINQDTVGTHAQSGFTTSDYIYVADLTQIKMMRRNAAGTAYVEDAVYYMLYDANHQKIANRQIAATVNIGNATYIRVSISTSNKSTFMLVNSALSVTEYIPFSYKFTYSSEPVTIYPNDNIIEKLVANAGKNIYFSEGSYDIISMYESYFGSDFFTNYAGYSANALYRGLPVYRGTTVTFSPNAKFTCNYSGNNVQVRMHFSAFALESGVCIDGLNIEASGIRNVIHDDFDNSYIGKTYIKNCRMTHDYIIIAGGFSLHDFIEISNCYFNRTDSAHNFDVSYHNNAVSGTQSELIVKNNYFSKGLSLRYYGNSELLSDCLVNSNSFAYPIEHRAENETATIDNIRILEWSNEIR